MRRTFLLLVLIALCFLYRAQPAWAQQPTQSPYDAALERSLAAHAAGDYAGAELAMREAHALSPNARTLRGLGVILYAQGRYVEAIAPLEAALVSTERALSAELRAGVEELLSRTWQRVGRLTLRVEPASREVRIDGAAPLLHGTEIVLSVGEHQVEITAPEREPYALTLRTQAGSRDSLHVVLAALPSRVAAKTERKSKADTGSLALALTQPIAHRDERWMPQLRNGLLGLGGALVVAGAASWLTAFVRFKALKKHCDENDGCERDDAEQRYRSGHILALNTTGIALASTGAAALLTVGALELWKWRTAPQRKGAADVRLGVASSALTLRAQF